MPRRAQIESITAQEAAKLVGGEVYGNPDAVISGVCSLDEPREAAVAFYDKKKKDEVVTVAENFIGSCLIIKSSIDRSILRKELSYICCEHPLVAISMLAWKLHPFWELDSGVSEKAVVHPSVQLGKGVTISEFVSVGENCVIEDGVRIYPGAVVYPGCKLGRGAIIHSGAIIREDTQLGTEVIIQSGAVIGGDGFGYYPGAQGLEPVPQVGNVVLDDQVDIGSNACVDRATFGSTRIGTRTKIDNLVQIGHNTKIGSNSIVCGLSGISGSCKIGNGVTLAGGVGVADQVSIEDGAIFAARSGLGTVKHYEKGIYSGFPAMSASRWRRREILISRLPELFSLRKKGEEGEKPERLRSGRK